VALTDNLPHYEVVTRLLKPSVRQLRLWSDRMRILTTTTLIALCFTQAIAQEFPVPVPISDELMYSRMQSHLKGRVRTVLTVQMSDERGYARTVSTATRSFDIVGAAIEDLYHNGGVELHSQKLVRLDYSTIYSYDGKRRLSRMVEYDPDGSLKYTRIFSYDEKGRPCEQAHYEGETRLIAKQGTFMTLRANNNSHVWHIQNRFFLQR
jgi:hypothetical protein